jgi:hypothetical protein
MDPNNSFAFKKLLSIYNCIFLFTYLATQTVSQHPKFKSCEPKNCGAGPNISYPFWLSQEQEPFCGHPNFMLTCSDKRPALTISNDVYILKISLTPLILRAWLMLLCMRKPVHLFCITLALIEHPLLLVLAILISPSSTIVP